MCRTSGSFFLSCTAPENLRNTFDGDACYGIEVLRYTVFWLKRFLSDGTSLTQNRRKYAIFFFAYFFGCIPRPWDFSSGGSFVFFPLNECLGEVLSSGSGEHQEKKSGAPLS